MNAITEFFQCDWPEMLERLQKLEVQVAELEAYLSRSVGKLEPPCTDRDCMGGEVE